MVTAFVSVDEVLKKERLIAATSQLARNLGRHVLRPALPRVEADHPHRVFILSTKQIGNDGFQTSPLDIGLAIGAAQVAEIIQHEIHRLIIVTVRHNRRGPSRPRHQSNSTPQNQQ